MSEYEEYLTRFCEQRSMTREQAEEQAIVKEVKAYYENKPKYTAKGE